MTRRYYTSITMRLLLLLSAFLTAMVGVGTPAAAAARPVCEVSTSATVRCDRSVKGVVVAEARTPIASSRTGPTPRVTYSAPARVFPLYAERLRV